MLMPPQNQADPYGFITNPESQPKRRISFGNTPRQRIVIVGVGFVLLIIIFLILSNVFNRAGNAQKDRLIGLAQTQAEIIRVAELADKQSTDINTRTLAINTKLTLQTDLQATTEFLAKRGVELGGKTLELGKDPQTDKALDEAKVSSRFDEIFAQQLKDQVEDYRELLKSAYQSGSRLEKQSFNQDYQELSLLL
jgi:hypothetical protein